jgi:hypothetical protein
VGLCQYGMVRCDTARCGAIRHGAVRYGKVRCDTAWCGAIRHGAVRYGTVRCDTQGECGEGVACVLWGSVARGECCESCGVRRAGVQSGDALWRRCAASWWAVTHNQRGGLACSVRVLLSIFCQLLRSRQQPPRLRRRRPVAVWCPWPLRWLIGRNLRAARPNVHLL